MAWAYVQSLASGANGGAASDTTAFGSNVAAGSLIVVAGALWDGVSNPIAVTDTRSTDYTVELGESSGGQVTFIAYGVVPSGGACTVTVDPTNVSDFSYTIAEFSGPHASPSDNNNFGLIGTSGTPSQDIDTFTADALLIGVVSQTGADTGITPGANYTQLGETESNSGNACHNAAYRIVGAPQLYTVDWSLGASRTWLVQTYAFKPALIPSAALTGTALASITEADIVAGGKTIIITLTNDTWVAN